MTLSPFAATAIFVIGVVAGIQYRRVWKTEDARWKAWVYGLTAAVALATVAFLPMASR
ncbi:MAG: hypothetical protein AAF742_08680 [Pseudomonadota bacterium]